MSQIDRRTLLQHCASGAATMALGSTALAPSKAYAFQSFPTDVEGLASEDGVLQLVQSMVGYGPRLTGNAAHKAYINHLAQAFAELGLQVTRDTQVFDRWEVQSFSLQVERAGKMLPVNLAGYHPYSGSTPPEGIKGRLAYLGQVKLPQLPKLTDFKSFEAFVQAVFQQLLPSITANASNLVGGVKGAIVLAEVPNLPLIAGIADVIKSFEYDPDNTFHFNTSYRRTWINGFLMALADTYKSLGAVGVVYILDCSPENAKGQYVPFFSKLKQFPGVLVDRVVGNQLRLQAIFRPNACLTLTATVEHNATSDSLVAILPGTGSENVIINTHTDGQNAFEENGAAACIALARYYAAKPLYQRPRSLVFSCVTGHMVEGMPQAQGFVDAHPDLVSRSVASLTIEHFGATEWQDSPTYGYRATGNPEVAGIFYTGGLLEAAIAAVKETDLRRTLLLKPLFGFFFGVGHPLAQAGIPTLAYIAGPEYLVAIAPDGHLSKFDKKRMRRELQWCVNVLQKIEGMTAAQLRG